jgi:uncharacterized protein (TIGR00251 family)
MKRARSVRSFGPAASYAVVAEAKVENFVKPIKGGVYLNLRVSSGAKSTEIKGFYGEGTIRFSVAAPPTKGKTNAEVDRYLARFFSVSRSEVAVVKGASSRDKLVFMRGTKPGPSRKAW